MGLLGIAVSPDDRYVYAFATRPDGSSNEIVRVARRGGDPEVVVEGIPAAPIHNGGGVAFGRDGSLFVSNGETGDESLSQSPDELGGKVYRFTASGDVPRDNPFGGPAFAIGLRNPYGLTVDPVSGDPFVTENGPEAFDEINRVPRSANLGWPVTSGPARGADVDALAGEYLDPVAAYPEIVVPTGIAFADPRTARPAYRGDLFFATYGEQAIHRLRLNDARTRALSDEVLTRPGEPVIALAWGPEGLYFSTPTAVHVTPLARAERQRPSPSPEPADPDGPAETPAAQDEPTQQEPESSFGTIALRVAIAAALIGALLLTIRPRRRR
jgi:glucose/arabinose dehydrogenase